MEKIKIFITFLALIQLTLQNPLDDDLVKGIKNDRIENKNWKLKAGLYKDEGKAFNEIPTTYRLPNNTLPVRYDIFLHTDIDKFDFNFYGRVKIQIRAVEMTNTVTLQYRDINVTKVSLLDLNRQVVEENLQFEYVEPKYFEFLRILLPRMMSVDENFVLEIFYNGVLNEDQAGFYRAYFVDGDDIVYYATTQFESTDARHAFPCYDEPAIRTPFGLEIQHDKSFKAYSNMEVIDETPVVETNYVVTKFHDTPLMQTYILAFLVAPFEEVSNNNTKLPQRIIAKPSSIRNGEAEFSLPLLDPIIRALESYLGVNYSLPKIDHAAITQFAAGAMENWGLITYREIALLFVPNGNPDVDASLQRRIITIISHEDAHQFFGNLVSPKWWTDLWLNEGLATLFEYYISHLLFPERDFMQWFRERELYTSFNIDISTAETSVPMSFYVESPKDIDNKFDDISYGKGGVVMRMFQEAFSPSTFGKGLSKYLHKMSFKAAVPDDLFSSMQEAFNEDNRGVSFDVTKAMGTWIYQAGYPLVRVSKSGNNFVFKQQRHVSGTEIYSIPLTFASKTEPDFERKTARIWLTDAEMEVSQTVMNVNYNDWVIFNVQQVGYYRMSYSSELWYAIARGLRQNLDKIHKINREVLIDELDIGYNKLEELLASDVLEVLFYLVNENSGSVWNRADGILFSISRSLFGTFVYDDFLRFIQFITRTQLEHIGYEGLDGEPYDRTLLRMILKVYNCYSLDDICLTNESDKLKLYMENNQNPMPDFCSAFRYVPILTYMNFLSEIISNPDLPNRNWIINGISCSMDKSQLELLTVIIEDHTNDLENFDRVIIIDKMLSSSMVGLEVGFKYLERNLHRIPYFISTLKTVVNTQEYSDKIYVLLDEALAEDFITLETAQEVKDAVKLNLEWQAKHFETTREWLEGLDERMTETTTTEGITTTTEGITTTTEGITTTPLANSTTTEGATTTTLAGSTTTGEPGSAKGLVGSFIFVLTSVIFMRIFG